MGTIIGVDIGTSVTKAVAFDEEGGARAAAVRRSHVAMLSGGRVEQDLDDVVAGVGEVVREVAGAIGGTPDAVALTGQGDGLWLRDERGRPVRRSPGWTRGPRSW